MLISLEQARVTERQLSVLVESNEALKKQLEVVQGTIILLEGQIRLYRDLEETRQTLQETKDQVCAEQIKAATPTWWDNFTKYMTGAGIGAVVAGVAILLL